MLFDVLRFNASLGVSFLIHSRLLVITFLRAEVRFQSRASQLLIALRLGWGVPRLHPNSTLKSFAYTRRPHQVSNFSPSPSACRDRK